MVIAFWGLISRIRPFPLRILLDCVTPAAAFALVLYRINCFMAGCCGGIPCTLPWSVRFGPGTPVFADQLEHGMVTRAARFSLPVHPTQLYEALFALAFGFVLLRIFRRRPQDGSVFLGGVLGYTLFRLIMEPLRIQTSGQLILGGWSLAQVVSLTAAVCATGGLLSMRSRKTESC
jgi:phosphatidylglycerol:prolipoprotein diacylglycerol transferase